MQGKEQGSLCLPTCLSENSRGKEGIPGGCDCSQKLRDSLPYYVVSSLCGLILLGLRPIPPSSDLFDARPDGAKASGKEHQGRRQLSNNIQEPGEGLQKGL